MASNRGRQGDLLRERIIERLPQMMKYPLLGRIMEGLARRIEGRLLKWIMKGLPQRIDDLLSRIM